MSGKDDKKIEEGTSKIIEIGSTTHFQCPMLKGANYTTWEIRMQVILEANGLWEIIEPNLTTEVDTKKDKTAIAYIYQSLPEVAETAEITESAEVAESAEITKSAEVAESAEITKNAEIAECRKYQKFNQYYSEC
ncbi:zinc finger, CCHC-type containing protein [Tanacetum coccineum]